MTHPHLVVQRAQHAKMETAFNQTCSVVIDSIISLAPPQMGAAMGYRVIVAQNASHIRQKERPANLQVGGSNVDMICGALIKR